MPSTIEHIFFSFITAFGITFLSIPSLISVAKIKNLYDEPGERKVHTVSVPTLGGIGIFAGLIFTITFWTNFSLYPKIQYIITAITIMAFLGIKDDIVGLSPFKKLMGQVFTAFILVIWGDFRINSLYGIFNIGELPYIVSIFFTVFTILVIINSFNLIDGINGLSGSIGLLTSLIFGIWFYMVDPNSQLALVAFALAGALIAFLRFNVTPAKIFMGDTGSLLLGTVLAVFAIEFIDINNTYKGEFHIKSSPMVAIGILIIPLFDLLRSFSIRIFHKKSPFTADRNHMHHMLVDLGFSHTLSTVVLLGFNIAIITYAFVLQDIGSYLLGSSILLLAIIFSTILYKTSQKKLKNK